MRYLILLLALTCSGIEEPKTCSDEVQVLKARIARLQVEKEISENPLVMRIRLAEYDAQTKYDEAMKVKATPAKLEGSIAEGKDDKGDKK